MKECITHHCCDCKQAEIEHLTGVVKIRGNAVEQLQKEVERLTEIINYNLGEQLYCEGAQGAEIMRLREALSSAAETIHDEFCSAGKHHPLCAEPHKALERGK